MNYREEMIKTMAMLGKQPNVLFLGQSILFKGTAIFGTLKDVPDSKKLEMPVAEELQLSMSIGLALEEFLPISIFPRMDFMMRCMDSLINHLDKIELLSEGRFQPRVIIRTSVGGKKNLDPGLQHVGNYIEPLRLMCKSINIVELGSAETIYPAYECALKSKKSSIIVEFGDLYE